MPSLQAVNRNLARAEAGRLAAARSRIGEQRMCGISLVASPKKQWERQK